MTAMGAPLAGKAGGSVSVLLPIAPWAQERPRLTTVGGFARAFDPPRSRAWKLVARGFFVAAMAGRPLLIGALEVVIVAVIACPPSQHRKRTPQPRRWHTGPRLDWDNAALTPTESTFSSKSTLAKFERLLPCL